MSPLTLKNVVVSTITPFEKLDHVSRIDPTAKFDLFQLNLCIPIVFFYKPQEVPLGSFKLVDLFKESLSRVLVPYFPFAGRWVRTSDARLRVLQCSDQGVPFIEASTDAELDSVLNLENFVSSAEVLSGYQLMGLQTFSACHDIDSLPSMFVQATQFKCGGVALHVTFCHMTADGQGMLTFMKAWSEIALHGQTSIVPSHDRSLISPNVIYAEDNSSTKDIANGDDDKATNTVSPAFNTSTKDMANGHDDNATHSIGMKLTAPSEPAVLHKTLYVKRDVIEKLKREAAEKDMQVSTVDLITAHHWRCISNLPESIDGKTCTSINTAVDGRQRFHNPPLSEYYSGNAAIVAELPQLSMTELSTNSLLFVASNVHKAVRAINPSTWEDSVARVDKVDCRQMIITSWFRFPVYDLIFSSKFGKPVFVSPNHSGAVEIGPLTISVFILPPPPLLSKDVIATLRMLVDKRHGQALLSDQEFLSFIHQF